MALVLVDYWLVLPRAAVRVGRVGAGRGAVRGDALMGEQTKWRMMKDGIWVESPESDLRNFTDRLGIFSDLKGVAHSVMKQMWAEIDRLRAERERYDTPAWQANERLNGTVERLCTIISDAIENGDVVEMRKILKRAFDPAEMSDDIGGH